MTKTGKHLSGRVARALDVSHIYKKQRPGASAGFLSPQTEQGNNMTERILTAVRAFSKGMVARPVPMSKSIKVVPGGVHHYRTLAEIKRMA